jgi:hypothetical protein
LRKVLLRFLKDTKRTLKGSSDPRGGRTKFQKAKPDPGKLKENWMRDWIKLFRSKTLSFKHHLQESFRKSRLNLLSTTLLATGFCPLIFLPLLRNFEIFIWPVHSHAKKALVWEQFDIFRKYLFPYYPESINRCNRIV